MLLIKELKKALPARAEAARARSLRTGSETAAPKAGFSCFAFGSGAVFRGLRPALFLGASGVCVRADASGNSAILCLLFQLLHDPPCLTHIQRLTRPARMSAQGVLKTSGVFSAGSLNF